MNKDRMTYAMLVPAFVFTLIFCYWPIYGMLLAFKDFNFRAGIFGSPWAKSSGLFWFQKMFSDPEFIRVLWNTVSISFW